MKTSLPSTFRIAYILIGLEIKLKEGEGLKEKLNCMEKDLAKLKDQKSPKARTITVDNELNYTSPYHYTMWTPFLQREKLREKS